MLACVGSSALRQHVSILLSALAAVTISPLNCVVLGMFKHIYDSTLGATLHEYSSFYVFSAVLRVSRLLHHPQFDLHIYLLSAFTDVDPIVRRDIIPAFITL